MKEIKDKNQINNEICQAGTCGCSVKHIWLGIVVIIVIIVAAAIFGN